MAEKEEKLKQAIREIANNTKVGEPCSAILSSYEEEQNKLKKIEQEIINNEKSIMMAKGLNPYDANETKSKDPIVQKLKKKFGF